ncbi:MAG TPA: cation diffusion facilitator family transporter [Phenylobacterium sp.]|uniref:cation diffusion facilitator family transporter n=1 Tax=Phenylobacterium sp. TaxID=1871053 RepID=UPI002C16A657|nr:cation diffusion facilitator family transporter [Phenylobacterium sp.]HSV04730.1 cation diffusion facilitator family transporter [Phenylobacterium sp.]
MDVHGLAPAETARLTRRVTYYSVGVAAVLVAAKLVVWLLSGSVALLASMADSALDLLASAGTFVAVRYAIHPPDAEHRFGHGKAEAFASLVQAGLVFASAALIGRQAIADLVHPHAVEDSLWAIFVMVLSTALTGLLIAAQTRVLRRAASVAVSGDRAHYAADLASNLVALVGIAAAAWLGVARLDPIAALIVAAILLWGAVNVFRQSSAQLMDRELPESERAEIVRLMTEDPRLIDVHQLRTRASGPYVHMQMHVDLDPELTLEAAHQVIVAAEKRVLAAFPAADIIIHADPLGRAEPHGGAFAEAPAAEA